MSTSEIKFHRSSWLVTLPLMAIAAVHILFVFYPGYKAVARLRVDIDYRQHYISDAAKVAAELASARQELADVNSYIDAWQQSASAIQRLPVLYGDINKLSKQSDTITTRFDPQLINELSQIRQIPINMACKGTITHLYEFIRSLESMPQTTWIDSLRFDSNGQTGENVLCEIKLVVFSDNPKNSNYIDINN
jgi:Tfp pilus assembly protein PilO